MGTLRSEFAFMPSSLPPTKAAELLIASWLLEAQWEVFTPVVDLKETDFVVRMPDSAEFVGIQVKSTLPDSLNAGQLDNEWARREAPFDYLIFIEGRRERGVILPRAYFNKRGKTQLIFTKDKQGYSRGKIRQVFAPFGFNTQNLGHFERAQAFAAHFLQIHRNPPPLPPLRATE